MVILESMPRSITWTSRGEVHVLLIDSGSFKSIVLDRAESAVLVFRHISCSGRRLEERIGLSAG